MKRLSAAARGRLLALAIGFALIGVAEGVLHLVGYAYHVEGAVFRFAGPDVLNLPEYVRDRRLFWRLRPGAPEVGVPSSTAVTNAAGFRGPLVRPARTPGVARVACMGDSITYGAWLPSEKTYVALVGRALPARLGRPVEMFNAGCPGYSTYQGLKLLETDVLPATPDVVTLLFGSWNDFTPAIGGDDEAKGARARLPPWMDPVVATLGRSRLFMAAAHGRDLLAGRITDPRFGQRTLDEYMKGFARGRPPEGERVPPEKFAANLAAMVRALRARAIEPVLITPPLSAGSQREYAVSRIYRDTVHEVAASEKVRLVQAAEHLAGWEGRGERVFADWVHPNAFGHEIIAALLAPELTALLGERGNRTQRRP